MFVVTNRPRSGKFVHDWCDKQAKVREVCPYLVYQTGQGQGSLFMFGVTNRPRSGKFVRDLCDKEAEVREVCPLLV